MEVVSEPGRGLSVYSLNSVSRDKDGIGDSNGGRCLGGRVRIRRVSQGWIDYESIAGELQGLHVKG